MTLIQFQFLNHPMTVLPFISLPVDETPSLTEATRSVIVN